VVKLDDSPDLRDTHLLARLRAGDEAAFELLVRRHHGEMIALARTYVRTRAVAEEVVQETWLAVLTSLDRFEHRASLKTWIFRILVNTAITRGGREARITPFSSLELDGPDTPAVDPSRFGAAGEWHAWPSNWGALPEDDLLSRETVEVVRRAVADLPPRQARVIAMRDIAGFTAEEVAMTLGISPGNQRILLHRARSKVRATLERHLDG
jgi:RNA polymerase sigma-70 factor (ECF subfamily)